MPPRPKDKGPGSVERKARLADRCVQLRLEGKTFRQIAEETGLSPHMACKIVKAEFEADARHRAENIDDYKTIQRMRLERMYSAMLPQLDMGNSRAIEVALKLMEREAKLMGLDAPEKSQVAVVFKNLSDEDLVEEGRRAGLALANVIDVASMALPGEESVPEAMLLTHAPGPLPAPLALPSEETAPEGESDPLLGHPA